MTKSQEREQMIEKLNSNITEKELRQEIEDLKKRLQDAKIVIRWYKDYVWKAFANDPKQIKIILLTQNLAEEMIPIDKFKAATQPAYRHEMILYRWHFALTLEDFCNDYLKKLNDKKFRNDILKIMTTPDDEK